MKSTLLSLLSWLFIATSVSAQDLPNKPSPTVNIGPDIVLPVGNLRTFHSLSFGGTAKFIWPVTSRAGLSLTSGYIHLTGKDFTSLTPNYDTSRVHSLSAGMVPVKAGLVYDLGSDFYIEPQLGVSYISRGGGISSGDAGSTGLTYAAAIGYKSNRLDFSMRYESVLSFGGSSFVAFRLAYMFPVKTKG